MGFGLDKNITQAQMKKKGYKVEQSPYHDYGLIVNDKYEFLTNSSGYRVIGQEKTIGQSKLSFFKMVDAEMQDTKIRENTESSNTKENLEEDNIEKEKIVENKVLKDDKLIKGFIEFEKSPEEY